MWKTCSRGHRFQKSSSCPVCPVCWSGYYRQELQSDFPDQLASPALRALRDAGITRLAQLTKHTEAEILELHGMGPKAMSLLKAGLRSRGLRFVARK